MSVIFEEKAEVAFENAEQLEDYKLFKASFKDANLASHKFRTPDFRLEARGAVIGLTTKAGADRFVNEKPEEVNERNVSFSDWSSEFVNPLVLKFDKKITKYSFSPISKTLIISLKSGLFLLCASRANLV